MGRKPEWWKDPALVTILVAIVTGAWVVSSRIGTLADRIGNHETSVSDRFGAVEARLAAIAARMELYAGGARHHGDAEEVGGRAKLAPRAAFSAECPG